MVKTNVLVKMSPDSEPDFSIGGTKTDQNGPFWYILASFWVHFGQATVLEAQELFWQQKKTFQAGGRYKNPIKTRETISTTEIFPLWPPLLVSKTSSSLEQGGMSQRKSIPRT